MFFGKNRQFSDTKFGYFNNKNRIGAFRMRPLNVIK